MYINFHYTPLCYFIVHSNQICTFLFYRHLLLFCFHLLSLAVFQSLYFFVFLLLQFAPKKLFLQACHAHKTTWRGYILDVPEENSLDQNFLSLPFAKHGPPPNPVCHSIPAGHRKNDNDLLSYRILFKVVFYSFGTPR